MWCSTSANERQKGFSIHVSLSLSLSYVQRSLTYAILRLVGAPGALIIQILGATAAHFALVESTLPLPRVLSLIGYFACIVA